ncbi:MAG: hypothetical protein L0H73_07095 [Nitrococcus sp.]|nr:hypothetical protein [Nitrococcus sp.]
MGEVRYVNWTALRLLREAKERERKGIVLKRKRDLVKPEQPPKDALKPPPE